MVVQLPAGAMREFFSLCHRFQTGSGAHPTSYPKGTRGSDLIKLREFQFIYISTWRKIKKAKGKINSLS
jgi:hypothetical protein